jgi:hypothetical protein
MLCGVLMLGAVGAIRRVRRDSEDVRVECIVTLRAAALVGPFQGYSGGRQPYSPPSLWGSFSRGVFR